MPPVNQHQEVSQYTLHKGFSIWLKIKISERAEHLLYLKDGHVTRVKSRLHIHSSEGIERCTIDLYNEEAAKEQFDLIYKKLDELKTGHQI